MQGEPELILSRQAAAAGSRSHAAGHDERLLAAVAAGDDFALGQLYDRHAGIAYAVALRVTGSATTAEEVVSDTFLRVWKSASSYAPDKGGVANWIAAIARHRALDEVRRRAARVGEAALPEGILMAPQSDDVARLDVRRALGTLAPDERAVLELAYFGGLPQRQIATRLGLSLGMVKSLTRRGLEHLRRGGALEP